MGFVVAVDRAHYLVSCEVAQNETDAVPTSMPNVYNAFGPPIMRNIDSRRVSRFLLIRHTFLGVYSGYQ